MMDEIVFLKLNWQSLIYNRKVFAYSAFHLRFTCYLDIEQSGPAMKSSSLLLLLSNLSIVLFLATNPSF